MAASDEEVDGGEGPAADKDGEDDDLAGRKGGKAGVG